MPDLITRQVQITRADQDQRLIIGRAVPFGVPTQIYPGLSEQIERGAITTDDQPPKLFSQHRTPIGSLTVEDREDGAWITAKVSATPTGDETLTLVRDGVLDRLSIGFLPLEEVVTKDADGNELITRTKVLLREVSVVTFPAYPDAKITETRSDHTDHHQEETPMPDPMPDPITRADLDALATDQHAAIDVLSRQLATVTAGLAEHRDQGEPLDHRSAAEVLQAIAAGDDASRELAATYSRRDYTGGLVGDDGRLTVPTFVADLTQIINNANPLANLFATAALPADGMSIEYARLKSNTLSVAKQAAEGDALALGKVTTETKHADIVTFGGYAKLSLQEIQRTRTNMLQLTLNGLATAAGIACANAFATFYEATVGALTTKITSTKAASALTWADLVSILSDATDAYALLGTPIDGLIVDTPTWKALASLTGTDGRPLLTITDPAVNTVGRIAPAGLAGNLAGITVIKNARQTAGAGFAGCFYNADALRTYTSGTAALSDQNITTLVNSYSVYFYAAHASEIPSHLLPLSLAVGA